MEPLGMHLDRFSLAEAVCLSFLFYLHEDGRNISSLLSDVLTGEVFLCTSAKLLSEIYKR